MKRFSSFVEWGGMALLAADISKCVLEAVAAAAPSGGPGVVSGVSIRHGWGDITVVEITVGRERHTGLPFDREGIGTIRSLVKGALDPHRNYVSVVELHAQ
jgi:hypothetical protein